MVTGVPRRRKKSTRRAKQSMEASEDSDSGSTNQRVERTRKINVM